MSKTSTRAVMTPAVLAGLGVLSLGAAPAAFAAQHPADGAHTTWRATAETPGADPQPGSLVAAMAQSAPVVTDGTQTAASVANDRLYGPPMSAAALQANSAKQEWLSSQLSSLATPATSSSLYLAANQQTQQRSYWCGPASVVEALGQMDRTYSQGFIATQLGTTTSGTDWSNGSGYPVANVLNDYDNGKNYYVAVGLPGDPSSSQISTFESDLVDDIGVGAPLDGDAVMVEGGPHLAGAPDQATPIYHWFDIRGYSGSGATTYYEDSAFTAYGDQSSSSVAIIVGSRGYMW
jgi:hypothetical protein